MSDNENQLDKLKRINKISNKMVHDIRTPVLTINVGSSGLEKLLPRLIEGYEYAITHGYESQPIRADNLQFLKNTAQNMKSKTEEINQIIDNFWDSINKETTT